MAIGCSSRPSLCPTTWSTVRRHYKGHREKTKIAFHPPSKPRSKVAIILKNFKLLSSNHPDTGRIFWQPPLLSFKRDKDMGNFLVRSTFEISDQPGTFKCARARCKTCPFIFNIEILSEPKWSIKITDYFTCTSANVIYCITCTLCKKLYIG